MKKIYSIIGLSILSATFAPKASAQAPCNTFSNILEDLTNGNCRVEILSNNSTWFGAVVEIYAGNDNVTRATGVIDITGRAVIPFICGTMNDITVIELKKNGNVCEVFIGERIVLPIVLGAFNASLKGSTVVLNWNSVQEAMSSHFDVEKSSDGKSFSSVGTVKAAGFSYKSINYSFTDKSFAGTGFYRLKLVDLDGKSKYSKVVYVNGGSGASTTLSVFPNPFRSDVQLKGINASDVNKSNIRVFNVAGAEVGFKITGSNSISIDAGLPQGVYILSVKGQRYKLVKE